MIRRVLAFGVAALLLTATETALRAAFGWEDVGLHLALGLVLYLAVNAGGIDGALGAAAVGYAFDLFSGSPVGLFVGLFVVVFLGVRLVSQGIDLGGGVQVAVVAVGAEVFLGLAALALMALGRTAAPESFGGALGIFLRQALWAALFAPLVYRLGGWIDRVTGAATGEQEVWLG